MQQPKHVEPLREAIEIVGSQAKLAKAIGKEQGHIWFWLNRAQKITPPIAVKIEQATGGKVSRTKLCPELDPGFVHE